MTTAMFTFYATCSATNSFISSSIGCTYPDDVYHACVKGNLKTIEHIAKCYHVWLNDCMYLNNKQTCLGYPIEIAVEHKQWDMVLLLLKIGVKPPKQHPSLGDTILHKVAKTNDQSEKKLNVFQCLTEKQEQPAKDDKNYWSPLYEYMAKNHDSLKKNDLILEWFINTGTDISGTIIKKGLCLNNIFENIICVHHCKSLLYEESVRITKITCSLMLKKLNPLLSALFCSTYAFNKQKPLCKIPKPIQALIANFVIYNNPVIQKIIKDLGEKVLGREETSLSYFEKKCDITERIFDSQRWKERPFEQYLMCIQQ